MVLFVDVLRPLPFPESLINRLIIKAIGFSPFVLDAKRNQEAWEQRFLERRRHSLAPPHSRPSDPARSHPPAPAG